MKYLIIIRGAWEDTEHPYPYYHEAFKAYDNFIILYSMVKGVTIILCTEGVILQQITF